MVWFGVFAQSSQLLQWFPGGKSNPVEQQNTNNPVVDVHAALCCVLLRAFALVPIKLGSFT